MYQKYAQGPAGYANTDQKAGQPLVSVIVCTYNRADRLRETLRSLMSLDYDNFELLVIDNNSSDNTASVVADFPKAVRIVETRAGVAHARNCGLANARGDFIAFIDDDETVPANWLQIVIGCLLSNPRIGAVTGPVLPIYERRPPRWFPDCLHEGWRQQPANMYIMGRGGNIGTGNACIRKTAIGDTVFLGKIGRKKSLLLSMEDSLFFSEIAGKGWLLAYHPEAVVWHWIAGDRLTMGWCMKRFFCEGLSEYLIKGHRVFWRRLGKPIPNLLSLLLSLFTFSGRRIVGRWLRLVQTAGIICGPAFGLVSWVASKNKERTG